ncbi:hypothetical protein PCANC_15934 [Puccinia coronata f. sp. avenae]|uniref:DUF6589 domain-containing protein n=1 Tax=Puccinia coronata f. sp. avenae TaxID=200324 RepID=A0A2N5SPL4_9BASI|nr:hypothetical protein PCANC_15934 [Puccinia coronata f. sp. avenae]
MFHGTWGYIHTINPELLKDVNPDDLKAKTVVESIKKSANLDVDPLLFMPSPEDSNQFKAVIKSQLAQALMGYIAATDDGTTESVILNPPPVDPIKPKKPDISMLKLMVASDNSSAGIGNVLSLIIGQTNPDDHECFARLQLMEGDLGTCLNLESLRTLRKPSAYDEGSLSKVFMFLGAAHTLCNVSQAIYLMHFGNPKDSTDLGACRILTMNLSINTLPDEKLKLLPALLNDIIDRCYTTYFGNQSIKKALESKELGYYNLLLRLRDFATIVEANRAMKASDIG